MKTMKTLNGLAVGIAFMTCFIIGTGTASAITVSEVLQTLQNLSEDQQSQLLDTNAGDISGSATDTTSDTSSDTTTTSSSDGLPLGKDAINFVRANSPSVQVNAARNGTPTLLGTMFEMPEDEPDFWDRVKEVFIDGLMEAILNTWDLDITLPTTTE